MIKDHYLKNHTHHQPTRFPVEAIRNSALNRHGIQGLPRQVDKRRAPKSKAKEESVVGEAQGVAGHATHPSPLGIRHRIYLWSFDMLVVKPVSG